MVVVVHSSEHGSHGQMYQSDELSPSGLLHWSDGWSGGRLVGARLLVDEGEVCITSDHDDILIESILGVIAILRSGRDKPKWMDG